MQVIAEQHGNLQLDSSLIAGRLQGRRASLRIDPAGIADHADVLFGQLRQQRRQHFDEVSGEPGLRVFQARAGHQRHGDLGQIIEHQIIQVSAGDKLGGSSGSVAPKSTGAADSHGGWHFYLRLRDLRQKCLEATKQALGL